MSEQDTCGQSTTGRNYHGDRCAYLESLIGRCAIKVYRPGVRQFLQDVANGIFSVDDQGRIWRHKQGQGDGWNYGAVYYDVATRRAELLDGNRLILKVHVGGRVCSITAACAVWASIHGEIPKGMYVYHVSPDTMDNHPSNLRLVTRAEIIYEKYRDGVIVTKRGNEHPNVKISDEDVAIMTALYSNGNKPMPPGKMSASAIARAFGYSEAVVRQAIQTRGKHIPQKARTESRKRRHDPKLTPDDVRAIRESTAPHRETAKKYGISKSTVRNIKVGNVQKYKELHDENSM